MELRLQRYQVDADGTRGDLFVDGVPACNTLEDVVHPGPKIAHETAIPAGRYPVVITWSPRFGQLIPHVLDVPGFTAIEIHRGNTIADTSGCVLVGHTAKHGPEDHTTGGVWPSGDGTLFNSAIALEALQHQIAGAQAHGQSVWLTIDDVVPKAAA